MEWFVNTLRHYPELAIFLTLGLGYLVGKLKLGKVTLGAVTGTLLVGVLVGQLFRHGVGVGVCVSVTLSAVGDGGIPSTRMSSHTTGDRFPTASRY